MAPPPAELVEEIVEEVLLRFPPDDPASLVRAALVCRLWRRLVSAAAFRRRTELAVWDPVTGEQRELPSLPMQFNVYPRTWAAAVLCAGGGNCDHLDCRWGSFLVVFMDIKHNSNKICSCVYSSELAAWGEQTFSDRLRCRRRDCFKPEPGVLMGNSLYFLFNSNHGIVRYDLTTREASMIDIRPAFNPQDIVLMTMDDGRLGFATIDKGRLKLNLWSRVVGRDDKEARFVQFRVIDLLKVFNAPKRWPRLSGFAHGAGVLFIWTLLDGLYSMDIKSEEVRKVPVTSTRSKRNLIYSWWTKI
ncbi:hypothetical protein PVAP13_2NG008300 [Panicum virgatum]|uniref:F-box domain-containing protein n=1 Tax=Panicum virgatum TaxID=38727 RepID=A0A8T0V4H5_PANVG|nr:hypothetical protein PVAP13_2NG008300 [Panicum virgatum]